jgi:hypothetical protein
MQGTPKLRCVRCGDVIGAYEPLVVLRDGRALDSSKTEMVDGIPSGECYHDACYAQAREHAKDE